MSKTQEQIDLENRCERLEKLASLTDAQRQYFNRVGVDAQNAFLNMSAADRVVELAPIYTSPVSGAVYNKSHDPSLVEMAKMMDAQKAQFDTQLAASKVDALKARADVELGHLPGTTDERAALLGAIENIADPAHREHARQILAQKESTATVKFARQGGGGKKAPVKGDGDPQAKFDALVEKHMADNDVDYDDALMAVCGTTEGEKLYNKIELAKRETANN